MAKDWLIYMAWMPMKWKWMEIEYFSVLLVMRDTKVWSKIACMNRIPQIAHLMATSIFKSNEEHLCVRVCFSIPLKTRSCAAMHSKCIVYNSSTFNHCYQAKEKERSHSGLKTKNQPFYFHFLTDSHFYFCIIFNSVDCRIVFNQFSLIYFIRHYMYIYAFILWMLNFPS